LETFLYLIRHGETEWNKSRRIQGHSNVDLSEVGEQQAERLAARFSNFSFSAIYSSDLKRAIATARRLAQTVGIPVKPLPSLRERCYGQWEGLTYEEIKQRFQDENETLYGIESFEAMQQRALDCLTNLATEHPDENIAVVSHGGFINAFLHYVTNGKLGTGITKIENTSVTLCRYKTNRWEVVKVNDTVHLQN
jgi:probable phosphoglycerate mutase/uncharacterized phosphatase